MAVPEVTLETPAGVSWVLAILPEKAVGSLRCLSDGDSWPQGNGSNRKACP